MSNRHHFAAPAAAGQRFEIFRASPASQAIATLAGYALVWNVLSSDRGGYVVRLLPGAASFASTGVLALYAHDSKEVLGSTLNDTLRLQSDEYGVRVEIDLPDTCRGRDVLALVRRRDVAGMSFAMIDGPYGPTVVEGGVSVMNVSSFTIDEVTITALPAFTATTIAERPSTVVPAYAAPRLATPIAARTPAAGHATPAAASGRLQLERMKLNARRLLPG